MTGMDDSAQLEHFMPHGMCYLWNARLLALHVISDAIIALAYFSIPVILLFFVRKRRDLPFPGVFAMFGLFIVACGMTHVLEIWTIWHPAYWLSGNVKAFTACVSLATAVLLVRAVPRALAIKGRADLSQQLAELNATLEQQVLVRTAKLHELSEHLQARTLEAETATLFKSQFLANMSHEIRSPMNAILGMLQLLQTTGLSARQADYAANAYTATQALLRLLNDILDFSKIEAGKLTFENAPFEIDAMLRDVSSLLSASLGTKPVELVFLIDEQLPERVQGDAFRLRQVLLNLAGNAVKFTSTGEIIVEMKHISRGPERCDIAFSVSDTGIGIAPDQLTAIFGGFNQGEASTTRRSGGSGLGLTISQRIVTLMGGQLNVESELGRGSRFYFTLTFDLPEDCAGGTAPQRCKLPSTERKRVLIVDDNEPARRALQTTTRSFGWASDGAASGREALDVIRLSGGGRAYDMIFVDWSMPELDGWETACRVRDLLPRGASVILMGSAHGLAELSARTHSDPNVVDAVLLKPVTAPAIIERVMELQARRNRVSPSPDRPAAPTRLRGLNILVVDDVAINVQIAGELLSIEGADVALAESGREALGHVLRSRMPFDVVLMDVQMPDMDGYETTRRLREMPQMAGVAIVAMTANVMEPDRAACLAAGMDDYIPKPIDIEVVVRTILSHTWQTRAARLKSAMADTASLTIDVEAALQRMANNRPLFATIAGRFIETSGELIAELRALLQTGAVSDAAKVFHQLTGFAGTVGNVPLAEMASLLETELKRTSHLPDPSNDLARLESLLAAGNAELERFLAGLEAAPATLESACKLDRTANRDEMRSLTSLLGQRNLSALDVYQKLAPALKATLPAESHPVLVAAMDRLDFAAAAAVLDAAQLDH
jgi:signal transduction histidine kinase/CheY-like chemotaxis protein